MIRLAATINFISAAVGAAGAQAGHFAFRKLRRKTGLGAALGTFAAILMTAWLWISIASTDPGLESAVGLFKQTWGAYALFLATSGSVVAWLNNCDEDPTESPAAVFTTLILLSPCIAFPLMILTLI